MADDIAGCPASLIPLRANRKCICETRHPDRNRQFEIIAETRKRFEDAGQPIISVFAVDCIEQWLNDVARKRYGDIRELLILCDGGGSNGVRVRFWKYALYQQICKKYGICIRVCHYPTGTSKWNPVEHRLFGPITKNRQGRPLRSFDIAIDCIRHNELPLWNYSFVPKPYGLNSN